MGPYPGYRIGQIDLALGSLGPCSQGRLLLENTFEVPRSPVGIINGAGLVAAACAGFSMNA